MNSVLTKVVATITVLLLLVTAAAFGAPSVRRDSEIATSCQIDCSNEKNRSICGSDGYTYPSECELRKYNCIHNKTISIKHEGSCKNCTEYKLSLKRKNAFPNMTDSEYKQKLINITHEMILQCYPRQNDIKIEKLMMSHLFKPKCGTGSNNHLFKPLQELSLCEKMWCVTHDGDYISDTAVSDQDLDCSARQSCSVNNIIYNDGVTFDGECGSCRCNNGQTNCITDYCGNEGLTNQLVAKLKDDLLQLYMRQYQNGQYITFDLFYLRENNIVIDKSQLTDILNKKFDHFNSNKDDVLQPTDLIRFKNEILELTKIKDTTIISSQLIELMDLNDDGDISSQEMRTFFTSTVQVNTSNQ